MAAQLATIPHAAIERVDLDTGRVDHPETGAYINIRAARSITTVGPQLIVELPRYRWTYTCTSTEQAEKYAHDLAIRAGR